MEIPFSQISERLNNRRFTVADNAHGLSGTGTVFHYHVEEDAISGTYQGAGSAWVIKSGARQAPIPSSFFISA